MPEHNIEELNKIVGKQLDEISYTANEVVTVSFTDGTYLEIRSSNLELSPITGIQGLHHSILNYDVLSTSLRHGTVNISGYLLDSWIVGIKTTNGLLEIIYDKVDDSSPPLIAFCTSVENSDSCSTVHS